jgi:hypothetical protein
MRTKLYIYVCFYHTDMDHIVDDLQLYPLCYDTILQIEAMSKSVEGPGGLMNYFSSIIATSFSGGRNRSTRR